jgi:hypothetical protein
MIPAATAKAFTFIWMLLRKRILRLLRFTSPLLKPDARTLLEAEPAG